MNVRHVNQKVSSIQLDDLTVMGMFSHFISYDVTSASTGDAMVISKDDSGSSAIYTASSSDALSLDDRVFLYSSVASEKPVNGMRWIPYIDSDDPSHTVIKPFREVFSYDVVYDPAHNVLTMWFWTNFNVAYTGTDYDTTELYVVTKNNLDNAPYEANRCLCVAKGFFKKCYVDGGICDADGSPESESFEWVPIFFKPKLVTNLSSCENSGVVVDIDAPNHIFRWEFYQAGFESAADLRYNSDDIGDVTDPAWSIVTDDLATVRIDFEDDETCGGTNNRVQLGKAECLVRASDDTTISINWEGEGGLVEDDCELMEAFVATLDENGFVLSEEKVGSAHSPGGNPFTTESGSDPAAWCVYGVGPVVGSPTPPVSHVLTGGTYYRIQFWVTTGLNKWHSGAYYQFTIGKPT